ncbi:hypothetical protein Neosp_010932 [[Neocosmospora] mangrovei]
MELIVLRNLRCEHHWPVLDWQSDIRFPRDEKVPNFLTIQPKTKMEIPLYVLKVGLDTNRGLS